MKILLVIPLSNYPQMHPAFLSNTDFPVGFAYIAAALKQAGHKVFGLNPNNDTRYESAQELLKARLIQSLIETNPHMIGLGGLSTDIHFIADAIQIIRSVRPHIPIVCGGGIITNDAEYVFKRLRPDFCIIGDAERALVQLVEMLEQGSALFDTIPNLGYWHEGHARFSPRLRNDEPVDSYPFPDYEPFDINSMLGEHALVTRYQYRYTRSHPVPMTLVAARGCPFRCSFCVNNDDKRYRFRSIGNIMDEIRVLYEKYHFNILIILDELFAVHRDRLQQFATALLEGRARYGWDFDWSFQTHASANIDQATLQLAKQAGCFFFSYGIESASPTVLASMNKRTQPEQIEAALKLAEQVQVGFGGNFIFGDPAETFQTALESLEFYKKHCLYAHVNVGSVHPYPGSRLFDYCLEQGIIADKSKYYDNIDQVSYNMTRLPQQEWVRLMTEIMQFTSQCGVPVVETKAARQDPGATERERHGNGNRSPWELIFNCPHCSHGIYTRMLLVNEEVLQAYASFVTGCPVCHKRFIVKAAASERPDLY